MTRTAMGGMRGMLIFKYSSALRMTSGLVLPVISRMASAEKEKVSTMVIIHQMPYKNREVQMPWTMRCRCPAP